MALVVGGGATLPVGVEPHGETLGIGRVAPPAVVLRQERAAIDRRVVFGPGERVRSHELVAMAEAFGQRDGEPLVPGLAEGSVLEDRGRGVRLTVHVVGAPSRAQGRDHRVVVDGPDLLLAPRVQEVGREREVLAQGPIETHRRLLGVGRLHVRIDGDLGARVERAGLGEPMAG